MALNVVVRVAQKWPCGTEGVKILTGKEVYKLPCMINGLHNVIAKEGQ